MCIVGSRSASFTKKKNSVFREKEIRVKKAFASATAHSSTINIKLHEN